MSTGDAQQRGAHDRLARKLLEMMVDQSVEHAYILLDPEGRIVGWYGSAEFIFGYKAEEVLGKRHYLLFTPEDVAIDTPGKELQIAREGAPAEDDRWLLRKDGVRFWAAGVLEAIRDEGGEILAFSKVLRNRTDLKGHLDVLTNRAETLEEANAQKNKFICTLAHELRNPLASLVGAVEILSFVGEPKGEHKDEAAFAIAAAKRQLDVMKRMVDDLLEVTRISAGKIQLSRGKEDLGEIVKAAADTCRPALDTRTHSFHLILGKTPVVVEADAARLQQVFVNLIENAAKYTEFGGSIWVKLFIEGREAVVKIEDTGIGISPEMLPRIFDMFTQAEFVGDPSNGGLGIGLSVVKDLVQLHGGTVQVRSDGIGKGSEFVVRLPLAGADRERPDSPEPIADT